MTSTAPSAAASFSARPRMRGWLHLWAFVVSIGTGAALIAVVAPTEGAREATVTAVYAATVSLLFGTSALYHRVTWRPHWRLRMKRLDHSMIFVFIAGTYTPFSVLVLGPSTGTVVLTVVWAGAVFGVTLKMFKPRSHRWIGLPLYLGLGWVAVFVFPALLTAGVAPFVLLLVGGAFYSMGAIVYGIRRPNPVPAVFGYHEVFHLCTVVAALCHYVAVWFVVYS